MLLEDLLDGRVNEIVPRILEHRPHEHLDYYVLLQVIANHSTGLLITDETFLSQTLYDPEKGTLLKEHLTKAWEQQKYQSIRDIAYLRRLNSPSHPMPDEAIVIEKAWNTNYVGEAAHALLGHIKDFVLGNTDPTNRQLDTRYIAMIQSPGMGKSRTVDQVAKSELVIPMVLQHGGSTGYPPPDSDVRAYLANPSPGAFQRVLAFLHALFLEVASVAKSESPALGGLAPLNPSNPFAAQFRAYMNHGMTISSHGEFRVQFYEKVIQNAYRSSTIYEKTIPSGFKPTCSNMDKIINDPSFPLNESCKELLRAIEIFPHNEPPLVILSFDDVHALGEHCIHLCRALRTLSDLPVFSVFLTTSIHMYKFISKSTVDPSGRMEGWEILPFTELGFDHFANDICLSSAMDATSMNVTLPHVSSTAQLVRFGRPLWATRYDKGDAKIQAEIIHFAAARLLGGIDPLVVEQPNLTQQLGCLAQRLPIKFLSVSYGSSPADPQIVQVQSHLRVVLRVDDELETMTTLSPSEPILSEAAYWLMTFRNFKPARALKSVLDGFLVVGGDRGEPVAMLLLTIARDNAVGPPNEYGIPQSKARPCTIKTFLSSLFVKRPWKAAIKDRKSSMEELLGDGKLYFNHFIEIHQFEMLNVKYIMRLMVRGAAILCATSQNGVDLVIPFVLKGDVLTEQNMGVILIQVKNDESYSAEPKPQELMHMSIEGLSGIPTLRFFFALAATESGIAVVDPPSQPPNTFDFWVAGLSSHFLRPVGDEGDAVWSELLDVSYGREKVYLQHGHQNKEKYDRITDLRRSMYPGSGTDEAHWKSWWKLPLMAAPQPANETAQAGGSGRPEGKVSCKCRNRKRRR